MKKSYVCQVCLTDKELFIGEIEGRPALLCGKCGMWTEWIEKQDIKHVESYIASNTSKELKVKNDIEEVKNNIEDDKYVTIEVTLKKGQIPKVIEFLNSL